MPTLSQLDAGHFLAAALDACRAAGEIHRAHFRSAKLAVEQKKDASPVTVADRASEEAIRECLFSETPELGLFGEEFGAEGSERDRWIIDPIDGTKNFVAGLPFFATLIALELGGELVLGVAHAPVLGPSDSLGVPRQGLGGAQLGETWWAVRGQGAWAGTGTQVETCTARKLAVTATTSVKLAFIGHGGLLHFQQRGLWTAFSDLVGAVARTRGFGDWWGHILVAEGRCDAMVEPRVLLHDVAAIKPIIEEAGGVFLTRGGAPLVADFDTATLSANAYLAEQLAAVLTF
jgi:histidinol-phosphatase